MSQGGVVCCCESLCGVRESLVSVSTLRAALPQYSQPSVLLRLDSLAPGTAA